MNSVEAGEISELNSKCANTRLIQSNCGSIGSFERQTNLSGNHINNTNNGIRIMKQGTVSRRYSSFSPAIYNQLVFNNQQANNKKSIVNIINNASGINIFSNNILSSNINLNNQNLYGNGIEAKKVPRKMTGGNFSDFRGLKALTKAENNFNSNVGINSKNIYPSKSNFPLDEEPNKSIISPGRIDKNNIMAQSSLDRKRSHDFHMPNVPFHKEHHLSLKKTHIVNKRNPKVHTGFYESLGLNINYNSNSNRNANYRKQFSNTYIAMNKDIINKISQEKSSSFDSNNILGLSKNLYLNSRGNENSNKNTNSNNGLNFLNKLSSGSISPHKRRDNTLLINDDKAYKRTSFLNDSPLNIINEDNENIMKTTSKLTQKCDKITEYIYEQKSKIKSSGEESQKKDPILYHHIFNNNTSNPGKQIGTEIVKKRENLIFNTNVNDQSGSIKELQEIANHSKRNSIQKNSNDIFDQILSQKNNIKAHLVDDIKNIITENGDSYSFSDSSDSSESEDLNDSDFFTKNKKEQKQESKKFQEKESAFIPKIESNNKVQKIYNQSESERTQKKFNKKEDDFPEFPKMESIYNAQQDFPVVKQELIKETIREKEDKNIQPIKSTDSELKSSKNKDQKENMLSTEFIENKNLINPSYLSFKIKDDAFNAENNRQEKTNSNSCSQQVSFSERCSPKHSVNENVSTEKNNNNNNNNNSNLNFDSNLILFNIKNEIIPNNEESYISKDDTNNNKNKIFSQYFEEIIKENNMELNESEYIEDYELASDSIDLETKKNLKNKYRRNANDD